MIFIAARIADDGKWRYNLMARGFVKYRKEDEHIVFSVRMKRKYLEKYDSLSAKYDCSRNKMICAALQYALEHLEFTVEIES